MVGDWRLIRLQSVKSTFRQYTLLTTSATVSRFFKVQEKETQTDRKWALFISPLSKKELCGVVSSCSTVQSTVPSRATPTSLVNKSVTLAVNFALGLTKLTDSFTLPVFLSIR